MNQPKKTWHRMALSLLGIAIVAGMWRWATFHLYSLPAEAVTSFTSITNNAFYVIAAIVIFMVTGRLIYEWKNTTTASVVQEARNTFEKRDEHVTTERIEHVIDEGTDGAPARRPFAPDPTHERALPK